MLNDFETKAHGEPKVVICWYGTREKPQRKLAVFAAVLTPPFPVRKILSDFN